MLHGHGEFHWDETGLVYIGDFKENKITGRGKIIWPNKRFSYRKITCFTKYLVNILVMLLMGSDMDLAHTLTPMVSNILVSGRTERNKEK